MIYLNLPIGWAHGWGVCGKYISLEMSRRAKVQLFTPPFDDESVGDALAVFELKRLLPGLALSREVAASKTVPGPILQPAGQRLTLLEPGLSGSFTLGYTFIEDTEMADDFAENAKHFDQLVAGSSWCAQNLRNHGLHNVTAIPQGVDRSIFFPVDRPRELMTDKFIIFSGGKFEFRKGHDLIIAAVKVMQQRHPDVVLMTAWLNPWMSSLKTMQQTRTINFAPSSSNRAEIIPQVLVANGIDMSRVIMLGQLRSAAMARMYHASDVGVFANRAEGGTNLVLMEYLACGKPTIATATTGHADVVNDSIARIIGMKGEVAATVDGVSRAIWPEPDLESIVESLEYAYQSRDAMRSLGAAAEKAMEAFTWASTSERFLALLRPNEKPAD